MIHILNTYNPLSGTATTRDLIHDLANGAHPPLGIWTVALGGPRRLLTLTAFDTLQAWQEDSATLSGADPAESIALRPLTKRRPTGQGPESNAGIYTMRTFNIARADLACFTEISEDGWWPWVDAGQEGVRPLAQWLSIIGPATRVYMISRYDNMAHWEASRAVGPRPTDPALVPMWETASAAIAERAAMTIDTEVCILLPHGPRWP